MSRSQRIILDRFITKQVFLCLNMLRNVNFLLVAKLFLFFILQKVYVNTRSRKAKTNEDTNQIITNNSNLTFKNI